MGKGCLPLAAFIPIVLLTLIFLGWGGCWVYRKLNAAIRMLKDRIPFQPVTVHPDPLASSTLSSSILSIRHGSSHRGPSASPKITTEARREETKKLQGSSLKAVRCPRLISIICFLLRSRGHLYHIFCRARLHRILISVRKYPQSLIDYLLVERAGG